MSQDLETKLYTWKLVRPRTTEGHKGGDIVQEDKYKPSLSDMYKQGKITAPEDWQRRLCWKLDSKRQYIESILRGLPVGTIILADVETGKGDFFQQLRNEGLFEFTSIDGNNRSNAIADFICGEAVEYMKEFLTGGFTINLGRVIGGSDRYKRYNDPAFPVELKYKFETAEIGVSLMTNAEYTDCSSSFISHNKGKPTSAQEDRNAMYGNLSKWMRGYTKRANGLFGCMRESNDERKNDKDLYCHKFVLENCKPPKEIPIDNQWKKELNTPMKVLEEFENFVTKAITLIENHQVFTEDDTILPTQILKYHAEIDSMIFFYYMLKGDKKYSAETLKVICDLVAKKLAELYSDDDYQIAFPGESMTYKKLVSGGKKYSGPGWDYRIGIMEDLAVSISKDERVNVYTARSSKYNNAFYREKVAKQQKKKCPLTGVNISKILYKGKGKTKNQDKSTYTEMDHIHELRHSGDCDDINNLFLVTAEAHDNKETLIREHYDRLIREYPEKKNNIDTYLKRMDIKKAA